MQILIVEDELPAAVRLKEMINNLDPSIWIMGVMDSIRTTVEFLNTHSSPDLILLDIQLADGLSFQIFEKINIQIPIIFTTAYDEFALRAFKLNSIDYLLKPIDSLELDKALTKFKTLNRYSSSTNYAELAEQMMRAMHPRHKTRFLIRIGEHLRNIASEEISFFYSNEKSSYIKTKSGRDFALDESLDNLEKEIDPERFFRVNRKFIIALPYLKDIVAYSGSRLKLTLEGGDNTEILVSREKVNAFKEWIEGK